MAAQKCSLYIYLWEYITYKQSKCQNIVNWLITYDTHMQGKTG